MVDFKYVKIVSHVSRLVGQMVASLFASLNTWFIIVS